MGHFVKPKVDQLEMVKKVILSNGKKKNEKNKGQTVLKI